MIFRYKINFAKYLWKDPKSVDLRLKKGKVAKVTVPDWKKEYQWVKKPMEFFVDIDKMIEFLESCKKNKNQ